MRSVVRKNRAGEAIMQRVLIAAFVLLLACQIFGVSAAATPDRHYTTIYAHKFKPTGNHPRGSLQGDFVWAANSPDLRTAAIRWKSFLLKYSEMELDSAIQARLISIAKYELMRIHYLRRDSKAGDKLLKELDPLQLEKDASGESVRMVKKPQSTAFSRM
jgi:hypothetical protein